MKLWKALLLFLLLVVLGLGAYVYLQARGLEVEQLTDDLWVVRGMGGNIARGGSAVEAPASARWAAARASRPAP